LLTTGDPLNHTNNHERKTAFSHSKLPILSLSLRRLCDLRVSAVIIGFKYIHRGDGENAEVARRISSQNATAIGSLANYFASA